MKIIGVILSFFVVGCECPEKIYGVSYDSYQSLRPRLLNSIEIPKDSKNINLYILESGTRQNYFEVNFLLENYNENQAVEFVGSFNKVNLRKQKNVPNPRHLFKSIENSKYDKNNITYYANNDLSMKMLWIENPNVCVLSFDDALSSD